MCAGNCRLFQTDHSNSWKVGILVFMMISLMGLYFFFNTGNQRSLYVLLIDAVHPKFSFSSQLEWNNVTTNIHNKSILPLFDNSSFPEIIQESLETQANIIFEYEHNYNKDNGKEQINMHFIKDIKHKLLYCFIPKNSCTVFKNLFRAIIKEVPPYPTSSSMLVHNEIGYQVPPGFNTKFHNEYRPSIKFVADKLLHDKSWKSMVILRDPLERLVSAYNDKCLRFGTPNWCEGLSHPTPSFKRFVNHLIDKMNKGNLSNISDHYRPQYTFCGMKKYLEFFNFIIYYNKTTIANQTLTLMKNAEIDISQYYHNWGNFHNETMFDSKDGHSSNISQINVNDRIAFFSKFYDKELANKVISAFEIDYKIFKFPDPAWLEFI